MDLLTQKLDQILFVGRGQVSIFTPPTQHEVFSICSSLTYFVNDCPMAAQTQNLFKNKFKQPKVSLGQLTIPFPTLTILAEKIIPISLGDPNLNNLKTFRNYLGLHTLNPIPRHQPLRLSQTLPLKIKCCKYSRV